MTAAELKDKALQLTRIIEEIDAGTYPIDVLEPMSEARRYLDFARQRLNDIIPSMQARERYMKAKI
jgi:hypothetical protein